ncbi:NAD(P)-dependent alcohol dehydrogenase [Kribbella sp. NPDC050241]|uniref:NAD(P)-dependent alcohol dehydrogenase n=1 Tax=Kribbella sp. NPDC050241 TaxID=3364115 RepID=UPI0037BA98E5
MRAAVHTRYGPPDVVRIEEVDEPVPQGNEVLVRVHATTVNRTDCGYRAAKPFITRFFTGLRRPRVTIMGTEFAGVVEAVGSGVTAFKVGERVFGYSEGRFGCHAELLTVPVNGSIAGIPANLTFVEVAPGTEAAHYALAAIRKTKIHHGQAVLVNGATGAIGSAAVQIIKGLGAQVTAVCDTAHLELVRGLGADRVIDYTTEDFTKDNQQYDVVLDAVGKSTFGRCRRLLKRHGSYLSSDLGPLCQNPVLALVTPLLPGKKVRFPIPRDSQAIVRHLKELIESGTFRPVIDRRYHLDQIVEAYRYVETGQKIGNVVIEVEPPR